MVKQIVFFLPNNKNIIILTFLKNKYFLSYFYISIFIKFQFAAIIQKNIFSLVLKNDIFIKNLFLWKIYFYEKFIFLNQNYKIFFSKYILLLKINYSNSIFIFNFRYHIKKLKKEKLLIFLKFFKNNLNIFLNLQNFNFYTKKGIKKNKCKVLKKKVK